MKKISAIESSDGLLFKTQDECQKHEMVLLVQWENDKVPSPAVLSEFLISKKADVIAILQNRPTRKYSRKSKTPSADKSAVAEQKKRL